MNAPRVAVVGAGPAGCAAAIAMHRRGLSPVLFERGQPGKDKPCGDAFMSDAVAVLVELGLSEDLLGSMGRSVDAVALIANSSRLWTWRLDRNTCYVLPRSELDQTLRDMAAGVCELRYGSRVKALEPAAAGGWRMVVEGGARTEETFDGIILAAGSPDRLSNRLGIDGKPLRFWSVTRYAPGPAPDDLAFEFIPEMRPGYGWCFPVGAARMNIGVCSFTARKGQSLTTALAGYAAARQAPAGGRVRGGAGSGWSGHGRAWHVAGGIISSGDAAGLIDPLTGEGLGPALESGLAAGRAMADFCDGRSDRVLSDYSDWVRHRYGGRYARTSYRQTWASLCGMTCP